MSSKVIMAATLVCDKMTMVTIAARVSCGVRASARREVRTVRQQLASVGCVPG
ncbi:MAG TPA: hypothetical protein VE783_13625 [Candidatus Limnocylindrales bacterium]|nr:hypothetical protein [Candidatus Limnocylindrales bacterium]